jgi:hypothetical protein
VEFPAFPKAFLAKFFAIAKVLEFLLVMALRARTANCKALAE